MVFNCCKVVEIGGQKGIEEIFYLGQGVGVVGGLYRRDCRWGLVGFSRQLDVGNVRERGVGDDRNFIVIWMEYGDVY